MRKGTRCHICTGCGLCFQERESIRVVTDFKASGYWKCDRKEATGVFIAVDIGTTTIAMVLYDSCGTKLAQFVTVNPQVKYGADVISRIQAAQAVAAAKDMRDSVRHVLEEGVERFQRQFPAKQQPQMMVVTGNTTMIYLLMGYHTAPLGQAPFVASHLERIHTQIGNVEAVVMPGLSAFVGADILAGIYACDMFAQEGITLLVDLGTNGEMVIGNASHFTACATAAGPAFEGGATSGIWGADMIHLTASLLQEGILDETGLLADEYFDTGILIGGVLVTQQAVRGLQLAKGAIAAGIDLLARQHGLQSLDEIERVVLAGGFGYFLQAEDAEAIGLLPAQLVSKVETGGNTALAGALRYGLALFDDTTEQYAAQTELERIRLRTKIINLAQIPEFETHFLEAMNFGKR